MLDIRREKVFFFTYIHMLFSANSWTVYRDNIFSMHWISIPLVYAFVIFCYYCYYYYYYALLLHAPFYASSSH